MIVEDEKKIYLFKQWVLISLLLVFSIIVVGGLTRLTDSGLSITEWELFKGIFPPLNEKSWDEYFELYKKIPQYKILNSNMSIEEFKIIFYWEYGHRILGRLIGLFFLIPLFYFHFSKKINYIFLKSSYLIFSLILLQGIIGWYMVKSGLVNLTSVSHYRLSLHLSIAIIIISMLFWLYINVKKNTKIHFFTFSKKSFSFFVLFILIFFQIILGAFVSGLDAGKIYQTWPLMGQNFVPDDLIRLKINLFDFDNHSLVQFYHRNLAYFITFYVALLSAMIFIKKLYNLYRPLLILISLLILQIVLGIITLISGLNIYLASAHQIIGVLLVFSTINLYYFYIK